MITMVVTPVDIFFFRYCNNCCCLLLLLVRITWLAEDLADVDDGSDFAINRVALNSFFTAFSLLLFAW